MQPLVSIIIPTFNRATFIGETLDSILAQTYTNWECIVVDDGSTDETELLVTNYSIKDTRIKYYYRPKDKPKGANACRNYGLKLSNGKYINWFDSDDLMHPDKLKIQINALENTDYPFSVCQSYIFEGTLDNIIGVKCKNLISDHPFEDFLAKKIVWLTQAPMFNKVFLINNNYKFDEELQAGQEWELFARILFDFRKYNVINKPLVYLRSHLNSISGNISHRVLWNYFLARHKIYKLFKGQFSPTVNNYLRYFFIKYFKEFLRTRHYKAAFFVWRRYLVFDKSISVKNQFLTTLSFLSFLILKKGDVFLTKVK